MPEIINLPEYSNENGILVVIEKIFPGDIKRVFFISDVGLNSRGGHHHLNSKNALICINGECTVEVKYSGKIKKYLLDSPTKCLLLKPEEYRKMYNFSKGAILLVVSDSHYDPKDYIYQ